MNRWVPCKRRDFISKAAGLGFDGPFAGRKQHFMIYRNHRLFIPSNREYSVPQLKMMIREIESILNRKISVSKWYFL